jgi:hypothetical protein
MKVPTMSLAPFGASLIVRRPSSERAFPAFCRQNVPPSW